MPIIESKLDRKTRSQIDFARRIVMSNDNQHALVIGGGVIGLCSAYYLSKSGFRVTILDRDASRTESCSEQNAGMIVPSHFIPLAAPGVISQGLKWMLNPRSPFYLRPRPDPKLWSWCWQFARHSNEAHVRDCKELLRDLSLESRKLFVELTNDLGIDMAQRGLMMLCQSEEGLEDEIKVAKAAEEIGIKAEVCDPTRIRELDPDASMEVLGGIWFSQDCHLDPGKFLNALRKEIAAHGGEFVEGNAADFVRDGDFVRAVETSDGDRLDFDTVILTGGAWTPSIAKSLDIRLPMQGGKGYSLTLNKPRELPRICSLLKEGRVAVTPMGNKLRVAGTMEICGEDLSVNPRRLNGIVESFCRFFPSFEPSDFAGIEPWSGLRPCSPDGLPYLGRVPGCNNAIIATGHSMLGLSLGPVTGRLVADLIQNQTPGIDIRQLDVGRYTH